MSEKCINNKNINNKGITLIALVVTIIILIILAGVSINLVIGENGIITRAKEQKIVQEIADITEKLELKKVDVAFESEKGNVPIDAYIEEVTTTDKMLYEITNVEKIDSENAYIMVDGKYEYLLEQEESGNLKITYQGEVEKLSPRIQNVVVSSTTNKIEVEVIAIRADKYVFYIKEKDGAEYTKKEENTSGKYTFKDLDQNKEYSIKVETVNDNGKDEREINRTTGQMTNLTSAEVKYIKSNTNWTNGNVTTTIEINTEKNIEGYDLQYTKFTGEVTSEKLQNATWTNYSDSGIVSEENEIIYTRLYDGTNSTSYTSTTINNIDKEVPTISTALSYTINSDSNITLSVGITDTSSGLGKIEWYYKLSNANNYTSVEEIYTKLNGSTEGTKTAITKTKEITNLDSLSTYKVYAKVYDVAGNSKDTSEITFTMPGVAIASIGTTKYASLEKAIDAISTNETIVMLADTTENITIPSGKTINLNVEGSTITGTINNKGTLNIFGTGKVTSSAETINNVGTLTIENVNIDSTTTSKELMTNTGILTIKGGTFTSTYTGIMNGGNAVIQGGTYNMKEWFLYNTANGTLEITGGNYTSTNNNGLINYGKVTISGSTVFNSCRYETIFNNGTLDLKGGTIKTNISRVITNKKGAIMTMSAGTISSTTVKNPAVYNYGTFTATGGTITITDGGYAVYTDGGTTNISSDVSITGAVN